MHQRKGKKILIYLSLLILISSINNIELNNFEFYKIKLINVSGLSEKQNEILLGKMQNLYFQNIFLINSHSIKEIISSNSLIENYSVTKKYPSTIEIKLKKTKFLAKINIDQKEYNIGSNGKLSRNYLNNKDLPYIFGKPNIEEFLLFKRLIDKSNISFELIKNFYFFPSRRWDIELKNNTLFKLPKDNLEEKLNHVFQITKDKNFENQKIFDLRMKNQLIINE